MKRALLIACSTLLLAACGKDEPPASKPVAAVGSTIASAAASASAAADANLVEGRTLVKRFGGALKGELTKGMSDGGPTSAISMCNEKSPHIAAQIEMMDGWSIRRTSLKLRNAKNKPDGWEQAVLERFEEQKAAGTPMAKLETHEVVASGGKKEFRYMKAIGTAGMCLGCHGANIDAEVVSKLDELYPEDKARGFNAGDIRGAFSLRKQL